VVWRAVLDILMASNVPVTPSRLAPAGQEAVLWSKKMHFLMTGRLGFRSLSAPFLPLLLLPLSITAAEQSAHWEDAWVRSVPPGAAVAAAYGRLVHQGDEPVTITGVTSSLGAVAQMHDIIADGDQRRMVGVDASTVAPGEALVFSPGGRHIMLMEFEQAPAEGDEIELCAVTQDGDTICTMAPVRRNAPGSSHHDSGHHH